MKKIVLFLSSFILVFSLVVPVNGKRQFKRESEVLATIKFLKETVTTRNLPQRLANIKFQLQGGKIQNTLPYTDEIIEKSLAAISVTEIKRLEEEYQLFLRKFGFYDVIEKAERVGVSLLEVTILVKEKDLNFLTDLGYEITVL